MHLLHYTNGEREYVVLTEDDAIDPEDHAKPGFTLRCRACILGFSFDVGREEMLPTDIPLERDL